MGSRRTGSRRQAAHTDTVVEEDQQKHKRKRRRAASGRSGNRVKWRRRLGAMAAATRVGDGGPKFVAPGQRTNGGGEDELVEHGAGGRFSRQPSLWQSDGQTHIGSCGCCAGKRSLWGNALQIKTVKGKIILVSIGHYVACGEHSCTIHVHANYSAQKVTLDVCWTPQNKPKTGPTGPGPNRGEAGLPGLVFPATQPP